MEQIGFTIITAILTGAISTIGTVKALNVHITYLNKAVEENRDAIKRAHQRIDAMQRGH